LRTAPLWNFSGGASCFKLSRMRIYMFIATLLFAFDASAQLEGTYQVAIKKQEEKKASRWSLADWLAQKQQNRMMDLWLAKNSHSSHYEFFLEGRSHNFGLSDGMPNSQAINENIYGGALAAYAGVAGLKASFDEDAQKRSAWSASFNLRLFGRAIQDTHLNIEYGLRGTRIGEIDASQNFQNQAAGVSMNIYLAKSFGLEGIYQRILPAKYASERELEGEDSRAGIFIDFSVLRIFGHWRQELLRFKGGGEADATEQRQGYGGGLRLYF
jgi:hypothetical protein